ncbi:MULTISPECIES: DUF5666 domain-containing protein [unclassified Nocardia]|uniref:DUF5666 domain-containing protein n=1 Tax=unclassified Nocardia TaxID=2637762 RepID=UPI001CE44AF4|nr:MULTISPECIES: DUF5666 domain-containing protein [unclassified Nocardia]
MTLSMTNNRLLRTVATTAMAIAAAFVMASCDSHDNSGSAPSGQPKPSRHGGNAVVGKIAAENAGSWTVTKRDGGTETVTITSGTVFGNEKNPETQAQFAVGDSVAIQGQESGDTITATHITKSHERTAPSGTPTQSPN